jgi:hypothetical protein
VTVARALGRFLRPVPRGPAEGEACELCAAPLGDGHAHVVDLRRRAVRCACVACAVLFREPGAGAGRFRTIPDRVLVDPGLELSDAEWAALEIPVGLAFLFRSSAAGRWIAVYPGAAGAIESALPLEAWSRLSARLPLAAACEADVEALLVRTGRGGVRPELLLVPIDRCYALAGRLRQVWRGFEGGAEARAELETFFAGLRARARALPRAAHGEAR